VPGWGCTTEALQAAVRKLRADQIDWLARVFRAQDDKRSSAEAKALAASVFATCQGALASARVTGRVKDFDAAVTLVRALWTAVA
jgi:TetR/AcrR family transcriptional repressor of nem operon